MSKIDEIIDLFNKVQLSNVNGTIEKIDFNITNIKNIEMAKIYGKIISAEEDINQSNYESDDNIKKYIQCEAQCKINEAIAVLQQDFINIIKYFVDWDNLNAISKTFGNRKYSEENIIKNINQLCDDYLYLKRGTILLMKLKKSQGISQCVLEENEKLRAFEEMIYMNEIYSWLPPENEENSWQHQLLYGERYKEIANEKLDNKSKLKGYILNHFKKKGQDDYDMQS